MRRRVLITGACGFAGRHMCDYLGGLPERPKIIGADILATQPDDCDSFHTADLTHARQAEEVIKRARPDSIIHFAGTFGTDNPQEMYRANVLATAALLEATRKYAPYAVVIVTGSAAEYGHVESDQLPIDEQTPCRPVTSYGLSKKLATEVALYYYRAHNICTVVVRPFQLIGHGLSPRLAAGAFTEQLEKAIQKGSGVLKVGNLESWRDFLDIRDAVEAIWALYQNPTPGEIYNLCSGKPTRIADLLQAMINYCSVDVKVEPDPFLLRGRADVSSIYGSHQKIRDHCGWQPKIGILQSLQEMFEPKAISGLLGKEAL